MQKHNDGNSPAETVPGLLQTHLDQLNKESSIRLEVIKERGYRSLQHKAELEKLGFSSSQRAVPGLLIPIWGVEGSGIAGYQFRPDNPRLNNKGKPIKYETPRGATNRLDCPPSCRKGLVDPNIPLWITEGVKKGDALASFGACVIDLTGIWNWRAKNKFGGVTVSSDFDSIALNGREVYIVPDSDYATNPGVAQAVKRLAEYLTRKKAEISIIILPVKENSAKTGVDDYLAEGHCIEDVKTLAVPFAEAEITKEPGALERSYFYANNRLYLEISLFEEGYGFAYLDEQGKVKTTSELPLTGEILKPRSLPEIEGRKINIVGMPDENITFARLLEPDQLYFKMKDHMGHYIDLPELDLELCVYYILFTWFYTKVKTLGYLRFLADTGKGKSRTQKVIGDLCFYPVFASGASSFSGIARLNNRWRGTLIMDEADTTGDKESQFVKYLNLGFERGKYYVLSDKQNPRAQEYFDPFSPKILAMRQPFKDNATEARLLSVSPHETTNPDIPIILPEDYPNKMQQLRNEIALFTLQHFDDVVGNRMLDFKDMALEPRLRQLAMPLSIVCQLWPNGAQLFREYLVRRQQEIRRVRSLSWEGSLVNMVIALANGDHEVNAEFNDFVTADKDVPAAIVPSMVSKELRASVKAITQALTSVGFQIEKRWITVRKGGLEVKKQVRAYTVPDARTWSEIISRYYYNEDGQPTIKIPQCLESSKYAVYLEASQVSQVSQKSPHRPQNVTLETLVTGQNTRLQNNNGHKPSYPCQVCGSYNWWRRNGSGWVCGSCHPESLEEVLFSLDLDRGEGGPMPP